MKGGPGGCELDVVEGALADAGGRREVRLAAYMSNIVNERYLIDKTERAPFHLHISDSGYIFLHCFSQTSLS